MVGDAGEHVGDIALPVETIDAMLNGGRRTRRSASAS
jgi:hypothetical protein